jgi:hypothetical protein
LKAVKLWFRQYEGKQVNNPDCRKFCKASFCKSKKTPVKVLK